MRSGFGVIDGSARARGTALLACTLASLACGGGGAGAASDDASRRNDTAGTKVAEAASGNGEDARPSRTAERGRVLFVGTSLTAGLGLDPSEAYPAIIAGKIDSAGLPYTVVNAGVSGETSSGALRRIDWLLREPVDVVVLETGANDGLRAVPVATLRANIEGIVDRVRRARPGARVLLVQMEALPNFGPEYTSGFREVYPEIAAEKGVTLVPFLLDGVAGEPALNQPDGIHPTAEGARIVAATVWETLGPVLAERTAALDGAAGSQ